MPRFFPDRRILMKTPHRLLSAAVMVIALMTTAKAQFPTPYTNSTSFLSVVSASNYTVTYNTFTNYQAQPTSPKSSTTHGGSYTAVAGSGTFYIPGNTNVTPADLWLSVFDPTSITLTNFSSNISAIGGNFFATDFNGIFTNIAITISATFADSSSFTTNYTAPDINTFFGLTSQTNLVSFSISADSGQYPTINNLTVGVPEPSTYALLAVSAAGLAGYAFRRRRR